MQIKRNTTEIQENKCGRTTDWTPINSVPTKNRDMRFYATPSNRNFPSTRHDDDEMRNRTRDTNNNNNWSSAKNLLHKDQYLLSEQTVFLPNPPNIQDAAMDLCISALSNKLSRFAIDGGAFKWRITETIKGFFLFTIVLLLLPSLRISRMLFIKEIYTLGMLRRWLNNKYRLKTVIYFVNSGGNS